MDKIENLKYDRDEKTRAQISNVPFISGPGEFLVQQMALQLRQIPQWKKIFGDQIDFYKRMDYAITALPALRMYNDDFNKEFESWFIEGDVKADIILPASVRRNDLQQVQDTLSAALLQQFRRPLFFDALDAVVPGLNELGKRFTCNKALGFEFEEAMVPLTQITINFRLDLRIWDDYLEETDRTKDSPFEEVLGNLENIVGTINGLKDDDETTEVTEGFAIDMKE